MMKNEEGVELRGVFQIRAYFTGSVKYILFHNIW